MISRCLKVRCWPGMWWRVYSLGIGSLVFLSDGLSVTRHVGTELPFFATKFRRPPPPGGRGAPRPFGRGSDAALRFCSVKGRADPSLCGISHQNPVLSCPLSHFSQIFYRQLKPMRTTMSMRVLRFAITIGWHHFLFP